MKKLIVILVLISGVLKAQETDSDQRKNDITLDPISLIAGPILNFTYERILNQDSGFGINFLVPLKKDTEFKFQISPYYRYYFGKKYAAGFFIDGFLPITKTEYSIYNYPNITVQKNTTVGIGIGFGGKWVVKRNFVLEISGGIARRFGNGDDNDNITGKYMVGMGFRF